jgi:hypothetical protein
MDGWKELEKMDLEIMHSLNREWSGERMRVIRRNDFEQARRGPVIQPVVAMVAAGLLAALLIGLALNAVGGSHLVAQIMQFV